VALPFGHGKWSSTNGLFVVLPKARIEITLKNARKLSISDGADASFVLELA